MNRFVLLLLGFILFNSICYGQGDGFIKFPDTRIWVIQINDSLHSSDQIISLKPGKYLLKARPQISYSWPGIYVEDELIISAADTLFYSLEKNISHNEDNLNLQQLSNTSYINNEVVQNYKVKSYLKDGILMGAVAANWLSFYMKRLSDSYYSDYKNASSASGIKKYKNKFKDFDLYSQITLGLSSALLTGYIYLTLTE